MSIPRLHPDTIEEVKQRVDIVDVISEHVVLRKRGKDYLGLCPFHNEKTPSFSVSQDKQLYYCFGCSEGGNTFKFLMEIGKQSFAEVVLDLASRYQVEIKTVEPEETREIQRQLTLKEQLYEILAVTASFYRHALLQPQGEAALKYLLETRKLQEATIDNFQLGYAPAGWETLYRYLIEQKRYPVNLVKEAGLIKERKGGKGYYDLFRDRLMIPIQDTQGRVIGFGSRTLKEDDLTGDTSPGGNLQGRALPKYLNSPETTLFDKSKTLFALGLAKNSIGKQDRAVVVEGYFDVIALHEAGIDNVVASLGTAFTSEQLKRLLRYTPSKQIILNFDSDNAGVKATKRAIAEIEDLVYGGVVQLKILNLPDGKDADELIKNNHDGVAVYSRLLDNASLWLDWQIERLITETSQAPNEQYEGLKAIQAMHPHELQKVAKGMVQLLDKLQDANLRNHYLTYCADLLSQGDSRLLQQNLASLRSQLKHIYRKVKPQKNFSQSVSGLKSSSSLATEPRSIVKKSSKNIAASQANSIDTPNNSGLQIQVATNPEAELLERAEFLLLQIYIHCPPYREAIVNYLEDKELIFTLAASRFLWQQIIEVEEYLFSAKTLKAERMRESNLLEISTNTVLQSKDVEPNPLLAELHHRSLSFPEAMKPTTKLFYLDEKTREDIFRAEIRIEEAIASLEQVGSIKHQLYCVEQLQKLDPDTDLECMNYYYQEIRRASQKIQQLEQKRLAANNSYGL